MRTERGEAETTWLLIVHSSDDFRFFMSYNLVKSRTAGE